MSPFAFFIYGLALVACIHTPSLTIGVLSGSLIDKVVTYLLISHTLYNEREIDYISSTISGVSGFCLWQIYVKGFASFMQFISLFECFIVSGISVFLINKVLTYYLSENVASAISSFSGFGICMVYIMRE